MSGPAKAPSWDVIARALEASGVTLTPYGQQLAGFRSICSWCDTDMGPAPTGCSANSHGICQPCADKMLAESRLA